LPKLAIKKITIRILGLAVLAAAAWYGYRFFNQLPQRQENLATAKVQRGDVVIRAFSRGELRATRSVTLTAPNLFSAVQVTRLAPMGSLSKEKDLIVEFDDSERRASLEETLLEVEQIDEQIKKAKADLSIRANQDEVELLQKRYAVRRAELEVKRNELLSAIDAKKNLLTLEQAKRSLQQLESDIKSRRDLAQAQLAVLQETRNKSMIDVQREQQRIAQAKVLSPMTGLVAVKQNRSGFFMFGSQVPDIREGDTLQPGMPVADVLDLSELEVVAKIGELDRANLFEGQEAIIQLDAVADKKFRGRIKSLSGTASSNVFSGDPSKKFDVVFSIDMRQLLAGLGMKPADIEGVMATAEQNAKRAPAAVPLSMVAMLNTQPGGPQSGPPGMPGGPMMVMPGGPQGAGVPDAQAAGGERGGRRGGGRRGGAGSETQPPPAADAKKDGKKDDSGKKGRAGTPDLPDGNPLELMKRAAAAASRFTDEDREKAKLPLPPEEDSQVQVLLRPGLLADLEIIVEKIPNALHVPAQAVFEKNGKPTVFVQKGKRFEAREVKLVKRSESMMVLAGGVEPGDVVALSDPTSSKSEGKRGKGDKKASSGGGAMGTMPASGGGK
jgi:multidrug efflux pump subunit AcrA (membrane-fusion protein)